MVDQLNMHYWRGGTYRQREGHLNTISLVLEVLRACYNLPIAYMDVFLQGYISVQRV